MWSTQDNLSVVSAAYGAEKTGLYPSLCISGNSVPHHLLCDFYLHLLPIDFYFHWWNKAVGSQVTKIKTAGFVKKLWDLDEKLVPPKKN